MEEMRVLIERFIGEKLSDNLWVEVQNLFSDQIYKKGELFAVEGTKPRNVAFVVEGVFMMSTMNAKGKEFVKRFATSNTFLAPYVSIVSKSVNAVKIQALTESRLYVGNFDKIEILAKTNIQIERLLRKIAEFFFIKRSEGESQFALYDAEQRYQIFLETHKDIQAVVPQYLIASFLGVSPTQLSRIRAKIKK